MLKKIDTFIVFLLAALGISAIVPRSFVLNWYNDIEVVCNVGITLIFFLYGLKMNKDDIKKGLSNYKLHLLVQASTFILFPLIAWAMKPLFNELNLSDFWIGFLFLAALPSTVSSSVVMVSIAKGNIPAAIFNASLSGLIGVIVTPIWMNIGNHNGDLLGTLAHLSLTILLPVVLGLLLNNQLGKWVQRYKKQLGTFDKSIILLIVFNSFSEAFSSGFFAQFSLESIGMVALLVTCILFLAYFVIWLIARAWQFSIADQITACFCGSKKSLIHGSVMVQSLFKGSPSQALILLPIMIYHSIQLIIISFIAQRYAQSNT